MKLILPITAAALGLLTSGCTTSAQDPITTFIPDLLRQMLAAYLF